MSLLILAAVLSLQAQEPRVWNGTEVEWARRPIPTFPMGATAREARVELLCEVAEKGRFGACTTTSESAPGEGFAAAAIGSMRNARLVQGPDAPKAGDSVRVRMTLVLPN